jgi:HK97 family phage major capsid protein
MRCNASKIFQRAAAHQTTADNAGLLPSQILGPVLNFVDEARPVVSALGARQLPSGSFSRPTVTQHTQVAKQTGEKTELASRKMLLGKIPIVADTYGGYVNVSRQNVDWTQPQILDIVINDLAGQYAIETENAAVDFFLAAQPLLPGLHSPQPRPPPRYHKRSGRQQARRSWRCRARVV